MKKILIISSVLLLIAFNAYAQMSVKIIKSPSEKIVYDDDKTANNKEYFGWAQLDSLEGSTVWKILRITYSGNDWTLEYADGNSNYDNSWTNRASLSYQ